MLQLRNHQSFLPKYTVQKERNRRQTMEYAVQENASYLVHPRGDLVDLVPDPVLIRGETVGTGGEETLVDAFLHWPTRAASHRGGRPVAVRSLRRRRGLRIVLRFRSIHRLRLHTEVYTGRRRPKISSPLCFSQIPKEIADNRGIMRMTMKPSDSFRRILFLPLPPAKIEQKKSPRGSRLLKELRRVPICYGFKNPATTSPS